VRRAQQFVYGLGDLKLREVGATYLDNYLDVLGRNASLQGRQPLEKGSYRQSTSIFLTGLQDRLDGEI